MTRPAKAEKPSKPYPDYPLSPHPCGQWCKRIHGKLRYFGPWADPEAALAEYQRQRPALEGGDDSRPLDGGAVTLQAICNRLLNARKQQVDQGELSAKTWRDYKSAAARLTSFFGPSRGAQSLAPRDFERFRASFPKDWGAVRADNEVIRVKAILNYAARNALIDRPIQTGDAFARASQRKVRTERAANHAKFFEAGEIHALLNHASPQMRAMILLGINAGYGNADCGRLTVDMLDLEGGWLAEPRHKTGVWRAAWLWPEAIDAIRDVLSVERTRVPVEHASLVFLTRYRKPWWVEEASGDPISKEFTKLRTAAGVFRKQVGFYSLRHVTQTIGEQAPGASPLAIKILMGHADSSISARYRENFNREQIKAVCEHLRKWWLDGKPKSGGKSGAV